MTKLSSIGDKYFVLLPRPLKSKNHIMGSDMCSANFMANRSVVPKYLALWTLHRDQMACNNPIYPQYLPQGHGHRPSPSRQNTYSIDWISKLPWNPQQTSKFKQLVHCSTTKTEFALLPLNLRFDKQSGINFPGEGEQCDTPVTGAHPLVPIFINGNHNPGLQLHRYCPWPPHDS